MPSASVESLFLDACVGRLNTAVEHIETCLGKLEGDRLWSRGGDRENAIANLILHLCGNVRQWIIHGLGGQPDIRVRELEFSTQGGLGAEELKTRLRGTISEAVAVISNLTLEQLTARYEIQTRKVSGVEAVLVVVEHFGRHTGQIIYATKQLTGGDLSLAAPAAAR